MQADKSIKGAGVYKTLLIWPYAVAPAIAGVLWLFMFQPSLGLVARDLRSLGIDWNPLLNGNHAMVLVVLASTWKQISYNFLFFLAGLQSIPRSVIEAAAIDGARPVRRFWTIIFPLLSPTAFFLLVVNIVYVFFDTFGIIDAMTGGGPVQGHRDAGLQGVLRRPARRRPRRLGGAVGDLDDHGDRAHRRAVPLHRAQGDLLMPSVMWKELTAADLRDKAQAGAVVVLPVASMEQHGPHLPVGVDTILCEAVCKAAAEQVAARDGGRGGADAVVRHGRASHGLRRHLHFRHPDLSRRAAVVPQRVSIGTASSGC